MDSQEGILRYRSPYSLYTSSNLCAIQESLLFGLYVSHAFDPKRLFKF